MAEELSAIQHARRRFRIYSWSGALLVAAIVVAINFVVSYVPLRVDTSSGGAYSISEGSRGILKKLDDAMVVKVVYSSQLPPVYKLNETYLLDLLSEYKRASNGRLRIERVDPGAGPKAKEEAISFGVAPVQLDVRERDRREVKECFMGVAFLYGDKREAIPVIDETANLEYEITRRLKRLIDPTKVTLGFVMNGHALTPLNSKSLEGLAGPLKQLYEIENVDLAQPVPPQIKSLWIIAPSIALDTVAVTNLRAYSASGGFVGIFLNRHAVDIQRFRATPVQTGLDDFLAEWGLSVNPGLVVDPRSDRIQIQTVQGDYRMINIVDYPFFPWVSDLDRTHPSTKGLDGISMPFVSAVEAVAPKDGVKLTSLARTSQFSFLDPNPMDLSPMREHNAPPNAVKGPFTVALVAERGTSRLLVMGTSRFIEGEYPVRPGNYGLFANLVDWAVQDEALIQIRSKGLSRRPLKEFPDGVREFFKFAMIFVLPLLSLAAGLFVWRKQKARRELLPSIYKES